MLVAVDLLLAPHPRRLVLTRRPVGQVRQGQPTRTQLLVANPGDRRVQGLLRDAWQPSAGATGNRHRFDLAGGDQVLVQHTPDPHPAR